MASLEKSRKQEKLLAYHPNLYEINCSSYKKPTIINAGAVTAGTVDKTLAIGAVKSIKRNNKAMMTFTKPVRPPLATPEPDST